MNKSTIEKQRAEFIKRFGPSKYARENKIVPVFTHVVTDLCVNVPSEPNIFEGLNCRIVNTFRGMASDCMIELDIGHEALNERLNTPGELWELSDSGNVITEAFIEELEPLIIDAAMQCPDSQR